MYLPNHFAETRPEVLRALMQVQPFATLVTQGSGGLTADHVPLELDTAPQPLGSLIGHVARANPLWRGLAAGVPALAIFHGPQAYVSPAWYPSKREHGKVVPTWNYVVVHAAGTLRAVEDRAWLRALVERLTARHEAGRREPWQVSDAPPEFLDAMLGGIVGIELRIERLQGKWKLSQNRPPADVSGVIDALASSDDPAVRAVAARMRDAAAGS
ncbi:MAG: FMN-binding negative transcriptional regulator [Deltaproteobacteria bacterium]|nr:FMN-binding negative transcriptional regulator [Deltaproteobacteria bacterium]